jgi:transcription elongation GreA/GreB family factor
MTKLHDAQQCIIDAAHIADLIEMAADKLENSEGGTISGAIHVASEKLHEAMLILSEAQREAEGSR